MSKPACPRAAPTTEGEPARQSQAYCGARREPGDSCVLQKALRGAQRATRGKEHDSEPVTLVGRGAHHNRQESGPGGMRGPERGCLASCLISEKAGGPGGPQCFPAVISPDTDTMAGVCSGVTCWYSSV